MPVSVWANDDKHGRAFELLHDSDSKRELVTRILGFELHEAFTDQRYLRLKDSQDAESVRKVATVKACLRCHGTWPKDADEKYPLIPPVPLNLGVSCQACHGPGDKWERLHSLVAWRAVTPQAKEDLEFIDCRTPAAKARLCASCHVGNIEQGKMVTHEWYAGGHPPLPSFELASFEAQMPAHWQPLREKGEFRFRDRMPPDDDGTIAAQIARFTAPKERDGFGIPVQAIKSSHREANFPDAQALNLDPYTDLTNARDAAVGGAAVLEMYVRLVADFAGREPQSGAGAANEYRSNWPELALYDCTACHHELRSGLGLNDRPKRNHTPGRPPLAAWPTVLAKLAAHQAVRFDPQQASARWSGVEAKILQFQHAATRRPFGDAPSMQITGADLAKSLQQLALDAANSRFDQDAARKAIVFLAEPKNYESRDFYAARQAAWAIRACYGDLGLAAAGSELFQGANSPLALDLPSGQNRSVMQNLNRWLPAAAEYDPLWFQNELKAARDGMRMQ